MPIEAIIALFSIEVSVVIAIFFKLGFLSKAINDLEKDTAEIKACLNLTPNLKTKK